MAIKNLVQIENVEAEEILTRLERIEKAVLNNNNQPKVPPYVPGSDLITRRDVSKMLRVSLVTISDWVDKGVLKAYKLGNRVYFKASEVESSMTRKGGIYEAR